MNTQTHPLTHACALHWYELFAVSIPYPPSLLIHTKNGFHKPCTSQLRLATSTPRALCRVAEGSDEVKKRSEDMRDTETTIMEATGNSLSRVCHQTFVTMCLPRRRKYLTLRKKDCAHNVTNFLKTCRHAHRLNTCTAHETQLARTLNDGGSLNFCAKSCLHKCMVRRVRAMTL